MKGKVHGFLSILRSNYVVRFPGNGKVFIFSALLGFLVVYSHNVFAQNKSFPALLPVSRHFNSGEDSLPETEPMSETEAFARHEAKIDRAEFYERPQFDNRELQINGETDLSGPDRTLTEKLFADPFKGSETFLGINQQNSLTFEIETIEKPEFFRRRDGDFSKRFVKNNRFGSGDRILKISGSCADQAAVSDDPDEESEPPKNENGFQWQSAVEQSLLFLAVQHAYAFTQPKTRRALRGNFLDDYFKSVKSLRGWGDGGRFFTNYIAHPMQGSFTGYIQIQNDPQGRRQRFGNTASYWKSRLKALAWSAVWSTQFEIGPLSQASIGNIGLDGKQTYVDLVVTPTVGTAMLVGEDAIDRYLIEAIERRTNNYYLMIFSRMLLNPTRTMANLIRFKLPWYRDRGRAR